VTGPRQWLSLQKLKDKLPNVLKKLRTSSSAENASVRVDRQDDQIQKTSDGYSLTAKRPFLYRDIKVEFTAQDFIGLKSPDLPLRQANGPDPKQPDEVKIDELLRRRTSAGLSQAERALTSLVDTALQPRELRWLGGEEKIRDKFLKFPDDMSVREALSHFRNRHNEIASALTKSQLEHLRGLCAKQPNAALKNKTINRKYPHRLPFLTVELELEVNIEKSLESREIERLIGESDEGFSQALDEILEATRKALIGRIQDQLHDLARRIKTLPHIELLSDEAIASTVSPYYGALNRALKKRRARSALVAVEELAREAKYQDDVIRLNEHREDYADVAGYYPIARGLRRELILYVGPTNSGKTWRALNELASAETGAYLAPLRLLALEGQEELEKRGKITSFVTGEEQDLRPEATFVSSTIEMLNVESPVDAVVVDEVQLLADERRGWAWLAAVVGAPAKKIIMTGSPDCIDIVRSLAEYLGEPLTIHECQRYNELRVASQPIHLSEIRPATAIVCFSRRDVVHIKSTIQENSQHKVAVVYGNLSPQVRREEARRFRSGEADVLVATDAIAMGLNLPISEVVFYKTEKFNGEEVVPLTPPEIRQIGGRAGRYGFADFGVVHALDAQGLSRIRSGVRGTPTMLTPPYYVAPGRNHVRIISKVLETQSLERILTFFDRAIDFTDPRFARSNIDDLSFLSSYVDQRLPFMDVADKLTIASAPVGIRNETVLHWFLDRMLKAFKDPSDPDAKDEDLEDLFGEASRFQHESARNQLELRDAEDYLKTLTVYAWLAYRYPAVFLRIEECESRRELVNAFVERSLRSTQGRRCAICEKRLPNETKFRICDACHGQQRSRSPGFRRDASRNHRSSRSPRNRRN
jgi:hypothetical protein